MSNKRRIEPIVRVVRPHEEADRLARADTRALSIEARISLVPDWHEFSCALIDHRVKFLVVEGIALAAHAEPRFTMDLDVLVEATLATVEGSTPRSLSSASVPSLRIRAREGPRTLADRCAAER